MTLDEWSSLESAFDSSAVARGTGPTDGLRFMGKQYRAVRADKNSVYARTSQGNGIVVTKTASHYIVAAYDPDMYASVCVEAVEKLGEFVARRQRSSDGL